MKFQVGDAVRLPHIGAEGEITKIVRRGKNVHGDRIFVRLNGERVGTGPDGTWITNEGTLKAYNQPQHKNEV